MGLRHTLCGYLPNRTKNSCQGYRIARKPPFRAKVPATPHCNLCFILVLCLGTCSTCISKLILVLLTSYRYRVYEDAIRIVPLRTGAVHKAQWLLLFLAPPLSQRRYHNYCFCGFFWSGDINSRILTPNIRWRWKSHLLDPGTVSGSQMPVT